jgi:tRNA pseudouridine55 synthase
MNTLINLYKPIGITPYQSILQFKKSFLEYKKVKIGFAGRLDPLAHGVLLLLTGNEAKNSSEYLSLSKEYEFEALFGLQTDTYDVLGFLQKDKPIKIPDDLEKKVEAFMQRKTGKQMQQYPPFSSKTILGKPLYWWARNNKLHEIEIPVREIEIYHFALVSMRLLNKVQLQKKVFHNISIVKGQFRQEEIVEQWKIFFEKNTFDNFTIARFKVSCSTGTYVRGLIHELGKELGTGAIAYEILRTKVEKYTLQDSINLGN